MNAEKKIHLKRLLRSEQSTALLADFAPLLGPEVSLAVSDGDGRLLASLPGFSPGIVAAIRKAIPMEGPPTATEATEVVITAHGAAAPICVKSQRAGLIIASGPLPPPAQTRASLTALKHTLESLVGMALERQAIARETLDRYREINLLYNMGETLATCLDMDELLERVLIEASQIIHARQGAVLLYDEQGKLALAAGIGATEDLEMAVTEGHLLAEEVARTGKPQIVNEFDVFSDGEKRNPLLAVPLATSEQRLGTILLVGKANEAAFTAADEKLLSALAWQATIAMENARLFDNVRRQRDEIATIKRYMDNIFASIASGVITTDTQDVITTFNRAAEMILLIPARQAVNRPYQQVLDFLRSTSLPHLIEDVRQHHKTYVGQEITPYLPHGEQRHLKVSLSTLQGGGGETLGVAIVVDDVTEKHQYERERELVRRYLPSGLVERLPHDLAELGLRGDRRLITILFADIRGFTGFSEVNPPERVMEVLNGYLTLAGAAIRFNQGIVDKYMGDAVMALFNTPLLEEEEHALRAVQAAWALKEAIESHHPNVAPDERLLLSFGICTGEVVVGNVGTEDRMEYTAIGDVVNLAKRFQETARPGQILISHQTWESVRDKVHIHRLSDIRLKGRQTFTRIYEVAGLVNEE
jgi:adenylate cyclase